MKRFFFTLCLVFTQASFAEDVFKLPPVTESEASPVPVENSKQAKAVVDFAIGNGGARIGAGPVMQITPKIAFVAGASLGGVIQNTPEGRVLKPFGDLSAGVRLGDDNISITPTIVYKCMAAAEKLSDEEAKRYGCGVRAGGRFFTGPKEFQFGGGLTKAITDVDHGGDYELELMFRIPLSSNDDDRGNNKSDLELDKQEKREIATSAAKA